MSIDVDIMGAPGASDDEPGTPFDGDGVNVRKDPLSKADQKLCDDLAGLYRTIGFSIGGFGQLRNDGGLMGFGQELMKRSEKIAETWLEVANRDAKIKAALRRVTEGSILSGLVILHVASLAPLLADRGIIPAEYAAAAAAM